MIFKKFSVVTTMAMLLGGVLYNSASAMMRKNMMPHDTLKNYLANNPDAFKYLKAEKKDVKSGLGSSGTKHPLKKINLDEVFKNVKLRQKIKINNPDNGGIQPPIIDTDRVEAKKHECETLMSKFKEYIINSLKMFVSKENDNSGGILYEIAQQNDDLLFPFSVAENINYMFIDYASNNRFNQDNNVKARIQKYASITNNFKTLYTMHCIDKINSIDQNSADNLFDDFLKKFPNDDVVKKYVKTKEFYDKFVNILNNNQGKINANAYSALQSDYEREKQQGINILTDSFINGLPQNGDDQALKDSYDNNSQIEQILGDFFYYASSVDLWENVINILQAYKTDWNTDRYVCAENDDNNGQQDSLDIDQAVSVLKSFVNMIKPSAQQPEN